MRPLCLVCFAFEGDGGILVPFFLFCFQTKSFVLLYRNKAIYEQDSLKL